MGQGFQFVPGIGPVPLGESVPVSTDAMPPVATMAATKTPQAVEAAPVVSSAIDPRKPLTGRQLLGIAKARVKEIDRQLRAMPALQHERAQLSALIHAAQLPKAPRQGTTH